MKKEKPAANPASTTVKAKTRHLVCRLGGLSGRLCLPGADNCSIIANTSQEVTIPGTLQRQGPSNPILDLMRSNPIRAAPSFAGES
jgi:hypothetical protein